eukprot:466752_1
MMLLHLPDDLIIKIISLLSLKQILNISSSCQQINKSCKSAIKQIKKIELNFHSFADGDIPVIEHCDDQTYISLFWENDKYNKHIVRFLKKVWNNIFCIQSNNHTFCHVIKHLQFGYNKLRNIELLELAENSHHVANYQFISHLTNLAWITIPFLGNIIWNNLITNCKNLHGISFEIIDFDFDSNTAELQHAPNLWSLSIKVHQNNLASIYVPIINKMLEVSENLKYLNIQTGPAYSQNYFLPNSPITLPSNLIGLKADFETLHELRFDLSKCNKLCYVDLKMCFLTECIEENWEHHQKLSTLLLSFLEFNNYTKFTKRIGISLQYENGTEYVSEEEKKAVIQQFKAIMEESKIYRDFNKALQIISTNYNDDLIEDWADKLFSISAGNIVTDSNGTIIMFNILNDYIDEIDGSSEILKYIQKCIDFDIEM